MNWIHLSGIDELKWIIYFNSDYVFRTFFLQMNVLMNDAFEYKSHSNL